MNPKNINSDDRTDKYLTIHPRSGPQYITKYVDGMQIGEKYRMIIDIPDIQNFIVNLYVSMMGCTIEKWMGINPSSVSKEGSDLVLIPKSSKYDTHNIWFVELIATEKIFTIKIIVPINPTILYIDYLLLRRIGKNNMTFFLPNSYVHGRDSITGQIMQIPIEELNETHQIFDNRSQSLVQVLGIERIEVEIQCCLILENAIGDKIPMRPTILTRANIDLYVPKYDFIPFIKKTSAWAISTQDPVVVLCNNMRLLTGT